VIEEHRRLSAQLDRARTRACQLQTILAELNETFAEIRLHQTLPCFLYDHMDRMLRQVLPRTVDRDLDHMWTHLATIPRIGQQKLYIHIHCRLVAVLLETGSG